MGAPSPVSSPFYKRRALTAFDLEKTLAAFLTQLFTDTYQLDNPTVNLAQASVPGQPIELPPPDPDNPGQVPFDPTLRAQTLYLKVPPRVVRGRIPRTVTGEIAVDKLSDVPSIIVQLVSAEVQTLYTRATVKILLSAYDENPDSSGYQDVLNMIETICGPLTSYGQQGIDHAYPLEMPYNWKLIEPDAFPHFLGEMTTHWQLPSGRPLPDPDLGFYPGEFPTIGVSDLPVEDVS